MSVPNPYSDVRVPGKSYFANEAFEHDQSSRSTDDAKEKFPGQFLQPGAPDSAQHNGAAARSSPASVANPYGSIYRSASDSKQAGVAEDEGQPWPCCPKWCRCCRCCCRGCVVS